MSNEGKIFEGSFKDEKIYTEDHQPLILNGILKAGHSGVTAGAMLTIDENSELSVFATGSTAQIVGVAVESIVAGDEQPYINYLAHGTVKASKLSADADISKLKAIGVYAV